MLSHRLTKSGLLVVMRRMLPRFETMPCALGIDIIECRKDTEYFTVQQKLEWHSGVNRTYLIVISYRCIWRGRDCNMDIRPDLCGPNDDSRSVGSSSSGKRIALR
jgi:hypothetical protein